MNTFSAGACALSLLLGSTTIRCPAGTSGLIMPLYPGLPLRSGHNAPISLSAKVYFSFP